MNLISFFAVVLVVCGLVLIDRVEAEDKKVVFKDADMSEDMQQDAVDCATQAFGKSNEFKDIAAYIVDEFDEKHDPSWHCIIGSNFGYKVNYEKKSYIYFYIGDVVILLFKSGSTKVKGTGGVMSPEMRVEASDAASEALEEYRTKKDIAGYIVKEFDKKHQPKWHCIVGRRHFAYKVNHEENNYISFHLKNIFVLLFKSG